MSRIVPFNFRCPSCGKEEKKEIYQSVNVTANPELKDKVLKRTINAISCPACGKNYTIDEPLLYHDMDKKVMIYYYPKKMETQRKELEEELKKTMSKLPPEHTAKIKTKIFFDYDNFIEEINHL